MKKNNYLNYNYFINQIYQYHLQYPSFLSKERMYSDIRKNQFINDFSEITADDSWEYFTPMVVEIFMNNLTEIKKMIDKGYNFNEDVKDGLTPLMIATYLDRREIIEYLYSLDNSVIDKKDDFGRDLLKFACASKNIDFVKHIIREADINSVDNNGLNAMHYNLSSSVKPTYIELIDNNAPGFIESTFKETNMGLRELINTEYDICKILVDNKIDLSGVNPISSLNFYWPYRHLDKTISLLLQSGCSTEFERMELTQFEEGEYSLAKLLEDIKDFDVSEWGDFPFDYMNFVKFEKLIKKYELTVYEYVLAGVFCDRPVSRIRTSYDKGIRK